MLAGFDGHLLSEHVLEEASVRAQSHGELGRSTLQTLRNWLQCHERLGPTSSLRAILDGAAEPLVRILGYDVGAIEVRPVAHTLVVTLRAGTSTPVLLIVTVWGERLDALRPLAAAEAARRVVTWCLLFNATHARLLDARGVYSRRYAQFDLEVALDDDLAAHGLWSIASAEALANDRTGSSSLERLILSSERRRSAVSRSLKDGVLAASEHMLRALMAGHEVRKSGRRIQELDSAFEQALTLVYQLIFLLFAEARLLVPLWHPVYRESYSVEALCDTAERGPSVGLWDGLRALGRLAHAGCRAGNLHVTPFNGRLFAPMRTPFADRAGLDDEAARHALLSLSTRAAADGEGMERISYRDLGVEQIGAIYETLLDYTPHVEQLEGQDRQTPQRSVSLRPGAGIRKATGTFYTPQPFVQYLVRRTLEPLVDEATPDQILEVKVLDPSMGSGAFLVGACTYLAECYESALIRSGTHRAHDFGAAERGWIRRTVAERCLFGVDVNPMAVQLARLSLWLATLAADRPLSFLDHHLVCGDSLLGAWLTSLRRAPGHHQRAVTSMPLFQDDALDVAMLEALPVRFNLARAPSDTPALVRIKERALAALQSRETGLSRWKRVADLWCAYWFSSEPERLASAFSSLAEGILTGSSTLPSRLGEAILGEAAQIAGHRQFFHWELEFPELFFDVGGRRRPDAGFDAVVGNPPWDMVRADSGQVGTSSARAAIVRFTRSSGAYSAQSDGHANSYQLFLERASALARPGGRLGLVLPFGLASDHGSAALRRQLFSQCAVDALLGFENRRGVFPIHRSVRFLLMTATKGAPTETTWCRFGETDPAALERDGPDTGGRDTVGALPLSRKLIEHLSGAALAIPNLRTRLDLTISERAATLFAPLGGPAGWNIRFGRELNATDDRDCLRPPGHGLPVIEGWQVNPFRANIAGSRWSVSRRDAARRLEHRHVRPRLAYRDVASPTNRVTLIAAVLPSQSVTTHTLFCLRTKVPLRVQYFLSGLFNSLVVNYLARLWVGTHVTTAIVERLPIPTAEAADKAFHSIADLARLLARRDDLQYQARLDVLVASLYQLTATEFEYVLSTFPLVPREHRDLALEKFKKRC
jgi:hypothetical protein